MMSEQLTTIYRANNSMQAHLLAQLLAEREIPSQVVGDSIISVESGESPVLVLVPVQHAPLAQFIAGSFDRNIVNASGEADDELPAEYVWDRWPTCNACGGKRMTWCPFCSTIGTEFELADLSAWGSEAGTLLLCSICDEPFEPRFHRACASCGQRFVDGVEGDLVSNETRNEILRTTIGAALFFAAFCGLVWWVLRS